MRLTCVTTLVLLGLGPRLGHPVAAQVVDTGFAVVARQIVRDSLRGAGHRADELYIATDSLTAVILQAAGTPRVSVKAPPIDIECPAAGLTSASVSPVGYGVTISDSAGLDPARRWLRVSVGCGYASPRRASGRFNFGEWGTWEIRRAATGWLIVRTVLHAIT